jgi:diguanylate cyclase (GGDEF)-like protein/PAS domain S-box-containing protein
MSASTRRLRSRPRSSKVHSGSFHEQLIENLYDGVYFVDSARTITYWNKAAEELTGYSATEAVGRHCFDNFLNHVDDRGCNLCLGNCPLARTIEDGERREAEVFLQHKDGHRVPVSIRVSPIHDSKKIVVGAVEVFTDVSAKKKLERRAAALEKMAFNDVLTGIPNRRFTQLRVKHAIQEARHFARNVGILMIDLDRFKRVNDAYGHELGDTVLQTASRTLSNGLRPGDFLGRWGGEEFLAIVLDVTAAQLVSLAERSATLLAQSPTQAESSPIHVTASIGATLVKAMDTQASLVKRADQLMYRSKTRGGNGVTLG